MHILHTHIPLFIDNDDKKTLGIGKTAFTTLFLKEHLGFGVKIVGTAGMLPINAQQLTTQTEAKMQKLEKKAQKSQNKRK